MIDTHTPIDPGTLDRAALLRRFWCPIPASSIAPAVSPYISQAEAAERLDVTQGTVSRWLDDGTMPVMTEMIVSRRRIIRASFDRWMTDHAAATQGTVAA